jgi:hypothetical protein
MFKSYKYTSTNLLVVDNDFQVGVVSSGSVNGIMTAIARVYEDKKLPVVPNIILHFKYLASTHKTYNAGGWINYAKSLGHDRHLWDEFYDKYKDDLDKYMILL